MIVKKADRSPNVASSPRSSRPYSSSPRKVRKVVPVASPRTRQHARATEHFPHLPLVVPGTEPSSYELNGVLHPQKKMKIMAEHWAQHDEVVLAHIKEERKWDLTKPEEQLGFFCSCYHCHHTVRRCNERPLVLPYYLANWMNDNSSIIAAIPNARDDLQRMHERGECFNVGYCNAKLFQAAHKEFQGRPT